jgi:hypothetical protein
MGVHRGAEESIGEQRRVYARHDIYAQGYKYSNFAAKTPRVLSYTL